MRTLGTALRAMLVVIAATGFARAHDIWTDAREYNRPTGFPCCGGDPVTGDCEGFTEDQVTDQPDGGMVVFSQRYHAQVYIPKERVMVDLPRYTDGEKKNLPLDPLVRFVAHWCGKPRVSPSGYRSYQVTPDDPDPTFHTFCAWRNAGGS